MQTERQQHQPDLQLVPGFVEADTWRVTGINNLTAGKRQLPVRVPAGYVRCAFVMGGWCGSDDDTLRAGGAYSKWQGPVNPLIQGHELVLRPLELGPNVDPSRRIKVGGMCVVEPYLPCRKVDCQECANGRPNTCRHAMCLGFQPHDGGFSSIVDVPDFCLYPIADNSNPRAMVMTEPLAICWAAISRAYGELHMDPNDWQWIIADKSEGLYSTLSHLASRRGTRTLVIALNERVATAAREMGATQVVRFQVGKGLGEQAQSFRELTDDLYPSAIHETTGRSEFLEQAVNLTRGEGRVVAYGGKYAITFEIGPVRREGTMIGWLPPDPKQRPSMGLDALRLEREESQVILGAGTIGLGLLSVLKYRQRLHHHPTSRVIVFARKREALDFALELGADAVHQIRPDESLKDCFKRARREVLRGSYPPVVFETTGSIPLLREAIHHTRYQGRTVALGCYNGPITMQVSSGDMASVVFVRRERNAFGPTIEMLTKAPHQFTKLIGRELQFTELPGVMDKGTGMQISKGGPKTIIVPRQ